MVTAYCPVWSMLLSHHGRRFSQSTKVFLYVFFSPSSSYKEKSIITHWWLLFWNSKERNLHCWALILMRLIGGSGELLRLWGHNVQVPWWNESHVHVQPHNRLMKKLPTMLVFRFLCPGFLFRLNFHIGEHFWTHQSATGVNRWTESGPLQMRPYHLWV